MNLSKYGLIIIVIWSIANSCSSPSMLIDNRLKSTYARIVELNVPARSGSYNVLRFQVNGKDYTTNGRTCEGYVLGDVFTIVYDPVDPKRVHHTIRYKPLFLENEKRGFTIAKVVFLRNKRQDFGFDYIVNGLYHHRFQFLEKFPEDYPIISKSALYPVEYWFNNPQRSIIYYEQPVTGSVETIATVVKPNVIEKSDTISYYSFSTGSDTMMFKGMNYSGIGVGDKFKMINYSTKICSSYPDVLYAEPLFLEHERTDTTTGEIKLPKAGDQLFVFKYQVNSVIYSREQAINFDIIEFLRHVKHSHKKYKVVYLKDNPQRAIIYLDQERN